MQCYKEVSRKLHLIKALQTFEGFGLRLRGLQTFEGFGLRLRGLRLTDDDSRCFVSGAWANTQSDPVLQPIHPGSSLLNRIPDPDQRIL